MSVHEVVRLIRDVHRLGRFDAFDRDREGFMAGYDLTEGERAALRVNDIAALYAMGVHPMAALFFGQDNKIPMPDYLEKVGASAERVAELRQLFGAGAGGAAGILPESGAH